jgi:glycosyltransferase involved in cell wall biosynthesis
MCVVDNESTDDTLKIARMFPGVVIETISNEIYKPGYALEKGICRVKNWSVVGFISAHCEIDQARPREIHRLLKDGNIGVIGKQIPYHMGKRVPPRYIWGEFLHQTLINHMVNDQVFFHNAFSFVKRDFILRNPFDQILTGREDREWATRMVNEGKGNIYYDNELQCKHHSTPHCATWKGLE